MLYQPGGNTMRTQKLSALMLLLLTSSWTMAEKLTDPVAEQIRSNYESRLFSLEPYLQRHYALRMYRITGEQKYLYPIISDLMIVANLLDKDRQGLRDPLYRNRQELVILKRFNLKIEKHLKRYTLLKRHPGMAFSFALLANLNMVNEVGLLNSYFFKESDQFIAYLKQQDFKTFFLNPDVVEIYSPQLATYIYFLYDLGIADLRQRFTEAFQRIFAGSDDTQLSDLLYGQKLYGMTHLIIGASRNYQQPVSRAEFNWIYDYFENNIDTIIQRAKPDIVAEVGIAYLLAGETDSPVVAKARQTVLDHYDAVHHLIPSTTGNLELSGGEHRNALAIMLLAWTGRLYPGPDLSQAEQYRSFWLKDYLP